MALRLFNTRTREVEPVQPRDPTGRFLGIYCCGPTVHDYAHVGNFRTFVFADLLRRHLENCGYQLNFVMNVTDVEDKIISRVQKEGVPFESLTRMYEEAFLQDLETLGCLRPHHLPRATEHIGSIIHLIERLVERGFAYAVADGSVYFSIEKYRLAGKRYGQLVHLNFDEMRRGERVRSDEYEKESLADFALWKARTPADGNTFWLSPWGEGRPGWHVECSAMSMEFLGASFDMHLGGEDLIFPHHEDEIAQSEGAELQQSGEPFVRHWVHGAHLLVEGKKMSKSLGNFFTLRDLLAKGFTGREIRYLLLTAHYREPFNFTLEGLQGARTALGRIDECMTRLGELAGSAFSGPDHSVLDRFRNDLDSDLNVSAAWGLVFEWIRSLNKQMAEGQLTPAEAAAAQATWHQIDAVFGLGVVGEREVPAEIQRMADDRQQARAERDFKKADELRDELKARGWTVEDTPQGPRLRALKV